MRVSFNADEIFELAERIERNGAAFYRKAAGIVSDPNLQSRLRELAAWEDEHQKTFASMRAQLTEKEREPQVFDPDDDNSLYLAAMADRNVFDVDADPAELLTNDMTLEDILKMAIAAEKDSIVFYVGMQPFLPERLGKGKIDAIINEEKGHIALLSRQLRELQQ